MFKFLQHQEMRNSIYREVDYLCETTGVKWRKSSGRGWLSKQTYYSYVDWGIEDLSLFLETIIPTDNDYTLLLQDIVFSDDVMTVYYTYEPSKRIGNYDG